MADRFVVTYESDSGQRDAIVEGIGSHLAANHGDDVKVIDVSDAPKKGSK